MPILGLPVIDAFERGENPVSDGGKWSRALPANNSATAKCESGQLMCNGDGNSATSYVRNDHVTDGPDCAVFCQWNCGPRVGAEFQLFLCVTGESLLATFTGYVWDINTDGFNTAMPVTVYRYVSGSGVTIDTRSFARAHATGDEYGLARVGGVFTYYVNGTAVGTFTETGTPVSTGAPGVCLIFSTNNMGNADNFGGGTLTAAAPSNVTLLDRGVGRGVSRGVGVGVA